MNEIIVWGNKRKYIYPELMRILNGEKPIADATKLRRLLVCEYLSDKRLSAGKSAREIRQSIESTLRTMCGIYSVQYIEANEIFELVIELEDRPERLPATTLEKTFRWILPRKTYNNTIEQMIGDFREEYSDSLQEQGKVTIRMRYLEVLLALNCSWCTLHLLLEKLLFLDKLKNRFKK